jgi:1-deoxy-D-xylulose-5-phosphate synthase
VMAPATGDELAAMMHFAVELGSPVAVRFPRGAARQIEGAGERPLVAGRGEIVKEGTDIAILALGDMVEVALDASRLLGEAGVSASVVNARFAKPIDEEFIVAATAGKKLVVTLEDNVASGGYGSGVEAVVDVRSPGLRVLVLGLPDRFIEHGSIGELLAQVGLSAEGVASAVTSFLEGA